MQYHSTCTCISLLKLAFMALTIIIQLRLPMCFANQRCVISIQSIDYCSLPCRLKTNFQYVESAPVIGLCLYDNLQLLTEAQASIPDVTHTLLNRTVHSTFRQRQKMKTVITANGFAWHGLIRRPNVSKLLQSMFDQIQLSRTVKLQNIYNVSQITVTSVWAVAE